ncbi:PK-1 [Euproctis pseudoconspersa nucleopolyhedrovirus]|uniref:non-specific serine/threonine protein kinase n=1 Tax=Euproctis pseudoconspersa nucleopolyhedrovirus TaxID=307467 RepID=C3TWR1_9ABAC|nr:PK-1 [Euproctis pseudoconspersa nucleopolyhedrovirus]ACO53453.1 PK-1 [Euproctis pseudoconspersa nucleopolyhedrovirus]
MDMFLTEFIDFNRQFVKQKQFKLINGKFGSVSVYKHEPTQKELLVKYIKNQAFNPIEPYVHHLMKDNKFFIKLYYSFDWLRGHLLIMDFIKEGDLFDLMKNEPHLTEDQIKLMVMQLVDALNALHNHKLIHNDVKLENVLCNSNMHIFLCDYGLCKHIGTESVYDGTLDYFSPEKINKLTYDTHFDWWAVGVLTFELMSYQDHPFKINKEEELTLTKLKRRHSLKVTYPYSMSLHAHDFVFQMLQFDITKRLCVYEKIKQHNFFNVEKYN